MAKKHNVKVNRGTFKLVGKVKGVEDDRFFKAYTFDSGSQKNAMSFSIKTDKNNESYVNLEGWVCKLAKFNKWDREAKKSLSRECSWEERFDFDEEGFDPSWGTRLKMDNKKDSSITTLFQYDACDELKDSLKDDMSVFVEGATEFSHYTKDGDVKRAKKLNITKMYRQEKDIDFESDKFKEENRFKQEFIFMGIEKELNPEDDKATGRFIVSAKVVTNESVEDVEFVLENKKLAENLRKKVKPYTAITSIGRLVTRVEDDVEEVEEEDGWGDEKDMDGSGSTTRYREWIITKVYQESIDTDTYSEEVLASITQAEDDYGDFNSDEDDDDDDTWD